MEYIQIEYVPVLVAFMHDVPRMICLVLVAWLLALAAGTAIMYYRRNGQ